jgi:hypothetical protein
MEIHSLIVGIFDPACELLPHGRRNYTCVLLHLYLLADLAPIPPSQSNVQYPGTYYLYTYSLWLGGGGSGEVVRFVM